MEKKHIVVYAEFLLWLQNYLMTDKIALPNTNTREFSLHVLIEKYESETDKTTNLRNYQRFVNKLAKSGIIRIKRAEQLYVSLVVSNSDVKRQIKKMTLINETKRNVKETSNVMVRQNLHEQPLQTNTQEHAQNPDLPLFSVHSVRFSIGYVGNQPKQGADLTVPIGRINKLNPNKERAEQAVYYYNKLTIQTFKKKLQIYIHEPNGRITEEQLSEARVRAYNAVNEFSKQFNLSIDDKYLWQSICSHHVCEDMDINTQEKPLFDYCGKEIKEISGTVFGDASHPNKIEHHKKEYAKGYEWHYLELPKEFPVFKELLNEMIITLKAQTEANKLLTEQIIVHLDTTKKSGDTQEKTGITMDKIAIVLEKNEANNKNIAEILKKIEKHIK